MNGVSSEIGRAARRLALVAALFATIGCDQVTKRWAVENLANEQPKAFLGDTVRLDYSENEGAFLGLGADWPKAVRMAVFTVGNGLLLVGFWIVAVRQNWPGHELLGMVLFVAGGTSNLLDRVIAGYVVDFINLGIGPVRTGIFNMADVAITTGATLVVLAMARRPCKSRPEHRLE